MMIALLETADVDVEILGAVTTASYRPHYSVIPGVRIRAIIRTQLSSGRWLEPGDTTVVRTFALGEYRRTA